MKFRFRGVAAF